MPAYKRDCSIMKPNRQIIQMLLLLCLSLSSSTWAMTEEEGLQRYSQAKELYEQGEYIQAISQAELLIEASKDNPRLSRAVYERSLSLISRSNSRIKRNIAKDRIAERRSATYDAKGRTQQQTLKAMEVDINQIEDFSYLRNLCGKAEPSWPYYVCKSGENCESKKLKWVEQLETNLGILDLTYAQCGDLKDSKESILSDITKSAKYKLRGQCMHLMSLAKSQGSDIDLEPLKRKFKKAGIKLDSCPRVKQYLIATLKRIKSDRELAKRRKEDNQKIAEQERAVAKAKLDKRIASLYTSGLLIKLTDSEYQDELDDRQDAFEDLNWDIEKWHTSNLEFLKDDQRKLANLESWQLIYLNYLMVRYCDSNQGDYQLIEDISELRKKMQIIALIMPIFISPDQLWTTTVNSPTYQSVEQSSGLLSDYDFTQKIGDTCVQQQTSLRLIYKDVVRNFTLRKHEKPAKAEITKDF